MLPVGLLLPQLWVRVSQDVLAERDGKCWSDILQLELAIPIHLRNIHKQGVPYLSNMW